jgi:hypothetical protein
MLSDKIYLNVFIFSLAIGIFLMYINGDDVKVVYVYPSIDTYNDILFQDPNTSDCYQYKPVSIQCPNDPSKIVQIPAPYTPMSSI